MPEPPKKYRKSSALTVLWFLTVLGFVVLGGCTFVIFSSSEATGFAILLGGLLMFAACGGIVFGMIRAGEIQRGEREQGDPYMYLFMAPMIATFVWLGGCFIALNG